MVDKNTITNWLLFHKDLFKLSYTQYDWPDRYLPGLHDFSCHIEFGKIKSEGRGISSDPDLAIEKASAEAIERYICLKLNIPSIGVAVSGEKSALIHAENEAMERFYLKNHIDLQVPFKKINLTDPLIISISNLINKFTSTNKDVGVNFYQMNTSYNKFGLICSIQNLKSNSYTFGFSFGSEYQKVFEKCFLEAIPNFAAINDEVRESSQTERPWHLSDNFKRQLLPLFAASMEIPNKVYEFDPPQVEVKSINMDQFPEVHNCPINPVHVKIINSKVNV